MLKEVYLLMIAGFALWVVHGVMIENAAVVLFGAFGLACCGLSLTLRFRSFVRSWW